MGKWAALAKASATMEKGRGFSIDKNREGGTRNTTHNPIYEGRIEIELNQNQTQKFPVNVIKSLF